ncbi:hypothetical protein ACHWQZ_G012106 [Mnemiopsis leidyi]
MEPPLLDENEQNLFANPAADPRKMRRIIAEDPEWSLATVPRLIDICVKHIVNNFAENPLLDELKPKHKDKVLEALATDLPLKITAPLVSDEGYWKRCCKSRWSVCDTDQYGDSWKRMFFERNMEDLIENFVPESTELLEITETLELSKDFIKRLRIKQLLPQIKDVSSGLPQDDEISDQGSDTGTDDSLDHFDFGPIINKLPNLAELSITYGVRNCGMNFEWSLFEFTQKDCSLLAKAVKSCRHLQVLRLQRCQIEDEKARLIISHLLDHPNLKVLDLSHNRIGDKTGRAVGKLLSVNKILEEVNLCDNNIQAEGASAIAFSLKRNSTLKTLNLKLNRIGDEGGRNICQALMQTSTLLHIDLSSNGLGEHVAANLAEVLSHNQSLEHIIIACNKLGVAGGRVLQEGLENNKVLQTFDLRLTDISQQSEHSIMNVIKSNKEKSSGSAIIA